MRPGTLLLADDDEDFRESLLELLEEEGWEVHTARDGQEALELALRPESSYQALLLDHRMPRMTGVEVHLRLQALGKWFPTVLVTAAAHGPELARDSGIPHHLSKPFEFSSLLALLNRILRSSTT